jgi:cathepsin X
MLLFGSLLIGLASAGNFSFNNHACYVEDLSYEPLITGPQPFETDHVTADSYDIRNINGVNYASTDLNQHIPKYCGSCWCHGAMSSVSDRINLLTKRSKPDLIPAIQTIINCGDAGDCGGGSDSKAYEWVAKNGVPDMTCQYYQAKNMECTAMNTCENCMPGQGCFAQKTYPKIGISQHGSVSSDDHIMAEISARGPVSCGINAGPLEDYTGGILQKYSGGVNHVIQLAGYGEENGVKFWLGRNSWGRYWGEKGWFRIIRGGSYDPGCHWAVPSVSDANWE